jgi:hypothetical protein
MILRAAYDSDVRIVAIYAPGATSELPSGGVKTFFIPNEIYFGKRTKTHRVEIDYMSESLWQTADVILAIGPDGKTAILRNKFGDWGNVIPQTGG